MLKLLVWLLFGSRKRKWKKNVQPPYFTQQHGPLRAAIWLNRSRGGRSYFRISVTREDEKGFKSRSLQPADLLFLPGLAVEIGSWLLTDGRGYVPHDVRRLFKQFEDLFASFTFHKAGESLKQLKKSLQEDVERERAVTDILAKYVDESEPRPQNGAARKVR